MLTTPATFKGSPKLSVLSKLDSENMKDRPGSEKLSNVASFNKYRPNVSFHVKLRAEAKRSQVASNAWFRSRHLLPDDAQHVERKPSTTAR